MPINRPRTATVKRLFNHSGQTCNYPNCSEPVVDGSGIVRVDICHIAGAASGSPRHDPEQSDEERHGFENLILLCPNHHRLVDNETDTYTVDKLKRMKQEASSSGVSMSNAEAKRIVEAMAGDARSVVISIGQVGGQTAETIVNLGKQPRTVPSATLERMKIRLERFAGTSIGFASFAGDTEASSFKRELISAFEAAGWNSVDQSTFMFFGDKTGVVLTIPFDADESDPKIQAAAAALNETGQLVGCNRGDMANEAGIYVQVWPAP